MLHRCVLQLRFRLDHVALRHKLFLANKKVNRVKLVQQMGAEATPGHLRLPTVGELLLKWTVHAELTVSAVDV